MYLVTCEMLMAVNLLRCREWRHADCMHAHVAVHELCMSMCVNVTRVCVPGPVLQICCCTLRRDSIRGESCRL